MAKVTLPVAPNGQQLRAAVNSNFAEIETALNDKVLWRDNPAGEPNQLEQDVDLNGNDLLNVKVVNADAIAVQGKIIVPANIGEVVVATEAQMVAGAEGVLVDAEQVRRNHVAQVATISDLRTLEPAFDGQQCELLGHTVAGVGDGMFYADFISSAADDNGVTIATVGGKRWVRKLSGHVTPEMFGAICDGVSDDRNYCQAALDFLSGDIKEIVFTKGLNYKVVNATGVGADIVSRRADAVLNAGLLALTSSQSGITVTIEGTISGTSPLDDIIRFTGNNVSIRGSGTVVNTSGEFLDTNSSDPTLQWLPSNIRIDGDGCTVSGLSIIDQVAVGIRDDGNDNTISFCEFSGGPSSHGPGTVQFGVRQTSTGLTRYRGKVTNCIFKRSQSGGACYSGVFSVCKDANISLNSFDSLIEHGVYANATGCIIEGNHFRNIDAAGAIQSFNGGTITNNRFEDCAFGQILVARPNNTVITGNVAVNAGSSGISVRTGNGDPSSTVYKNLIISNNIIDFVGSQSAIDVSLNCSIDGLIVAGNQITNAAGSGVYGPVRLEVTAAADIDGRDITVTGNTINGSEIYAIYLKRFAGGKVIGNTTRNTNKSSANIPVRFFGCSDIEFSNNTIHGSLTTSSALFASDGDGNSRVLAFNNNCIGLSGLSGAICTVPTGSSAYGNGRNTKGSKGKFQPANVSTAVISDGAAESVRPPGLVVLSAANSVAATIQSGANRISVTSVGDGQFTWATDSGGAIGTTGAIFFYEIYQ